MPRVIVEQHFETPVDEEEYTRLSKRLDNCLELRNAAWVRSAMSTDRKHMICEFEAPDAESVRQSYRSVGAAFTRVWSATVYAVEDYPEPMAKLTALRAKV